MKKGKIPVTVLEISISKIFVDEFDRKDLEDYFAIRSDFILSGLRELLKEENYNKLVEKLEENERKRGKGYE